MYMYATALICLLQSLSSNLSVVDANLDLSDICNEFMNIKHNYIHKLSKYKKILQT